MVHEVGEFFGGRKITECRIRFTVNTTYILCRRTTILATDIPFLVLR